MRSTKVQIDMMKWKLIGIEFISTSETFQSFYSVLSSTIWTYLFFFDSFRINTIDVF